MSSWGQYSGIMAHIHELKDFTVSAFVLHLEELQFLLLHHNKIGKWLQFGGYIELNENPIQALNHELHEETGLKPDQWEFVGQPDYPKVDHDFTIESTLPLPFYLNEHNFSPTHQHIDLTYLVKARTATLTKNPDGASAIGWFTLEQVAAKLNDGKLLRATHQVCEWIAKKYF